MFYGAIVWDPWLIVGQIVCLQCLYYLTLGLFLSMLVGSHVSRMSLVYFFDYSTLTASTVTGWCSIASFLLSAIAGIDSLEGLHMQSFDAGILSWVEGRWNFACVTKISHHHSRKNLPFFAIGIIISTHADVD